MKFQTILLLLGLSVLMMGCPFSDPDDVEPLNAMASDPAGADSGTRLKTNKAANKNSSPISPQTYTLPLVDRIVQYVEFNGTRFADITTTFFYNSNKQINRIEVLGGISRKDYYEPRDKAVFEFSYNGNGTISNGQLSFDLIKKNEPLNPSDMTYPFNVEYNSDGNVSKINSSIGIVLDNFSPAITVKYPAVSTFTYENDPDQYGNRRLKTETYMNGGTNSAKGDLESVLYFHDEYTYTGDAFSSKNSQCQQMTNPQQGIACTNFTPQAGNVRNYTMQSIFRPIFDKKALFVITYLLQQYNQQYNPSSSTLGRVFPYQLTGSELTQKGDIKYDALGNAISIVISDYNKLTTTIYYQ